GGTAVFSVTVGESPTLSYQWFKDGEPLTNETGVTLTIANVQGYDIGSYHVVVTNGAGSTASAPTSLSIGALARVNRGPTFNGRVIGSVQQMLGTNAVLNSSASVSGSLFAPGTP